VTAVDDPKAAAAATADRWPEPDNNSAAADTGASDSLTKRIVPSALRVLDRTWPTIADNLAVDEAMLQLVQQQPAFAVLRFWEATAPCVIIGRSNRRAVEVQLDACAELGVPVLRRCSGGGAVVLGAGCLCYALALPVAPVVRSHGLSAVTQAIMQRISFGLSDCGVNVTVQGVSDLVYGGRKCSGNSARWLPDAVLHHGTILYQFDLEFVSRCLRFPSKQPDYRASRPHADFVTNLPVSRAGIVAGLSHAWSATEPPSREWFEAIDSLLPELLESRYRQSTWHEQL
jgi:lipoate---protein ligase